MSIAATKARRARRPALPIQRFVAPQHHTREVAGSIAFKPLLCPEYVAFFNAKSVRSFSVRLLALIEYGSPVVNHGGHQMVFPVVVADDHQCNSGLK